MYCLSPFFLCFQGHPTLSSSPTTTPKQHHNKNTPNQHTSNCDTASRPGSYLLCAVRYTLLLLYSRCLRHTAAHNSSSFLVCVMQWLPSKQCTVLLYVVCVSVVGTQREYEAIPIRFSTQSTTQNNISPPVRQTCYCCCIIFCRYLQQRSTSTTIIHIPLLPRDGHHAYICTHTCIRWASKNSATTQTFSHYHPAVVSIMVCSPKPPNVFTIYYMPRAAASQRKRNSPPPATRPYRILYVTSTGESRINFSTINWCWFFWTVFHNHETIQQQYSYRQHFKENK